MLLLSFNHKTKRMKIFLTIIVFISLSEVIYSQTSNPRYNKSLADSLGANDYGMKAYVLVILKTGTAKIENKALTDSLFRGHMDFIQRMANEGKLIVAGPLQKNEHLYRGIYIFDVSTIDEAQKLISADPSVKNNVFATEMFVWYGSAALPLYLREHEKIEKFKF